MLHGMMADRISSRAFVGRRVNQLAARFSRERDGAAAVEFALIAGVLELGLLFVMSTSLDNATSKVARTIRTGSSPPASAPEFRTRVCNELGWLATDCESNLFVDVDSFATFDQIVTPTPIDVNGVVQDGEYTTGQPEQIILVRVYYQWKLIAPLITKAVENVAGGKTLVTSSMTFRNEPFS
jgi:Flp pilus assembly protein TadG